MQPLFAWILFGSVIVAAYPWSAWLLEKSKRRDGEWLTLLLTLSLSTGMLTLLMFWQAVIGIRFNLSVITLSYFGLMLIGWWLWRRRQGQNTSPHPAVRLNAATRLAGLLIVIICGAVVFNGAYWPFSREDTLGIYHRYGTLMYQTGALVPFQGRDDAFYQAYPIHIPLIYTYAYLASGWLNEYLAKTVATLLSLACVPAVFVLGRMMYGSLAGWSGALLLAFTPTFARWSSTGYVDLPMAFYYTLAGIFAWRLWKEDEWIDALLTGIVIGLAAWTKNAALVGTGILTFWLGYAWIKRRIQVRHIVMTVAAYSVIAAPWYIRNWREAGLIVPPTAWTEQAERSLRTLFLFITHPQDYAFSGWVILAAIVISISTVFLRRQQQATVTLLAWTVPFFGVWWLLVSYDPRFVLLFFPLLCVLGGGWLANAWRTLPERWQRRGQLPLIALACAWTLYIIWISVEHKGAILSDPLMGDAIKHEIVLNDD